MMLKMLERDEQGEEYDEDEDDGDEEGSTTTTIDFRTALEPRQHGARRPTTSVSLSLSLTLSMAPRLGTGCSFSGHPSNTREDVCPKEGKPSTASMHGYNGKHTRRLSRSLDTHTHTEGDEVLGQGGGGGDDVDEDLDTLSCCCCHLHTLFGRLNVCPPQSRQLYDRLEARALTCSNFFRKCHTPPGRVTLVFCTNFIFTFAVSLIASKSHTLSLLLLLMMMMMMDKTTANCLQQ